MRWSVRLRGVTWRAGCGARKRDVNRSDMMFGRDLCIQHVQYDRYMSYVKMHDECCGNITRHVSVGVRLMR